MPNVRPCPQPCVNCGREGLPILFTRYAVAYSAQEYFMETLQELRPQGNFQSTPSGVD